METGIEPVCTALQAVASPLGHSTAGLMRLHHRADDGIRTRDPNLGKVVRYQLRYIRVHRARSSLSAMHDDSASTLGTTNLDATTECGSAGGRPAAQALVTPWWSGPNAVDSSADRFRAPTPCVIMFLVVHRSQPVFPTVS